MQPAGVMHLRKDRQLPPPPRVPGRLADRNMVKGSNMNRLRKLSAFSTNAKMYQQYPSDEEDVVADVQDKSSGLRMPPPDLPPPQAAR